jgi:parvulin-like peptidyl-prolyl isomerase
VKKLPYLLVCLLALVGLVATGCGPVAAYAATVNGDRLSQEDLNAELEAIRDNTEYSTAVEQSLAQGGEKLRGSGKNTFDSAFVARVLTRQIFLSIVQQGIEDKKLTVTKADLDKAREQQVQQFEQQFGGRTVWDKFPKEYQETLVRRAAEVEVLQKGLAKAVTDDEVKAFYEANKAQFSETCSRHILASFPGDPRSNPTPPPADVEAQKKAQAQGWKDRIAKGEDFAAIAKAESGDTGSGAQGGDLGCQGGFVEEFTTAMNALQPGQTSDPVRTQFGYHVIQVTSRKDKTLEESSDQIRQQLEQQSQGAVQTFLEEQLGKAKIKVNPRYGTFAKGDPTKGEQPGVVPPEGPATTTTTGLDPNGGGLSDQDPGTTPSSTP